MAEAAVAQRRAAGQPSSRYAGVNWQKSMRQWRAQISHEGRKLVLGYSAEEEKAARAREEQQRQREIRAKAAGAAEARAAASAKANSPKPK